MLEHMKKHPTKKNKTASIKIIIGDQTYSYAAVPVNKIEPLKKSLKEYENKKNEAYSTESWDSIFKDSLNSIGGEKKYRQSALTLQAARENAGLSQFELAQATGLKQGNISQIETAKRGVGLKVAKIFSNFFNKSYIVFLSE